MKSITLCADDYGQNFAISQAIIDLLKENRLSATSCMVTQAAWQANAKLLDQIDSQCYDLGLHFNLTEGEPVSNEIKFYPLPKLITYAIFRQLNCDLIERELHAQLDVFETTLGRLPDFIDGHQHIHQFPGIQAVIFKVYQNRFPKRQVYLRNVQIKNWYQPQPDFLKKMIIQMMSAAAFEKKLVGFNVPHNKSFSGIYSFKTVDYRTNFRQFLSEIQSGGLIMCHPARSRDAKDTIAIARVKEYQYFSSEQFLADCADMNVKIKRFKLPNP